MKITKEASPRKGWQISSDDGSRFIVFSLFSPLSSDCNFLDISFVIDKIYPAFEFSISFIFFNIFYRSNKPETMKMFDEIEKELEENKSEYIDIDTFIDDLNKNKKG